MKRLIAGAVIALCASAVQAQVIGPQESYNILERICEQAGDAAATNYMMLSTGDGTYELPAGYTGSLRRLLEASEDLGAPYRATSPDNARVNGWSYCIDNFRSALNPHWKPSL